MNRRIAAAADAAGSLARELGQLGSLATLKHQSSRHEKGKRETEIERETKIERETERESGGSRLENM